MGNVLVLCPSHRDYRELAGLGMDRRHRLWFHEYASVELEQMVAPNPQPGLLRDVLNEIEDIVARFADTRLDGVVSTDDYPGSAICSLVAQRLGLPAVPPAASLLCQHKYHARVIQQAVVPEAVPAFALLAQGSPSPLGFPLFVKPVKSFFSVGAYRVDNSEHFLEAVDRATLPEPFFEPLKRLFDGYSGRHFGAGRVLGEEWLEGVQATIEGYAFQGQVHVFGIVDSVMFPGSLAFQRFEYPSSLPAGIQARMVELGCRIMRAIGFDNGLFNIEIMYNQAQDTLRIIEINPRMASQFADLYEKVDGFNSYEILLDLALGRPPVLRSRQGRHRMAASCVLRTFADRRVVRVPSDADVAAVVSQYPDARVEVLAVPGRTLSEEMQDSESYRYGIVSLGGTDIDHILARFSECERALGFVLEPPEPLAQVRVASGSGGHA